MYLYSEIYGGTYHRFVVVITTLDSVRILGVNCGTVTETLWSDRPELRSHMGREWTKEHYQSHRKGRVNYATV